MQFDNYCMLGVVRDRDKGEDRSRDEGQGRRHTEMETGRDRDRDRHGTTQSLQSGGYVQEMSKWKSIY